MIGFWKFFLDNRAFTYFLVFISIVVGLFAVNAIPKESAPEITLPVAVVSTPFFGASASDVEQLVTNELEQRIETVSDIAEFTSTSRNGLSTIVVEFEQSVDIDERTTRLKEAVDRARIDLPEDGNEPVVNKIEFSAQPVLTVSLVSDLPYYSFQQIVDVVEDEILDVSGVAEVTYSGIPEREIGVVVDNRKLLETGIDFQTVVQSLGSADVRRPVGSVVIRSVEYPLDLQAEIASFQDLLITPIGRTGVSSLTITDIADVYNGYAELDSVTRVGTPGGEVQQSVTINVSKKDGGDITQITAEVREVIEGLSDSTLKGVETIVTFDAGENIARDLGGLLESGAQTVVLVFIVLFIAVGFRESLIAAISIPLSFMLAFIAFLFVGNTINFISLFSLILSVGILVDTAIVVVEGINAKIQEGKRRQDAAVETVKEYGLPLIAGTMTTIGVFFPLLFLSGITGQFIASIPYTIIFVLLASLFVSLAFVTVWCASFLKNKDSISNEGIVSRFFTRLENKYSSMVKTLLTERVPRRLFQGAVIIAFITSFGLVGTGLVKVEFFPGGDLQFAFINIEKEAGSSLVETDEFTRQVESLLETEDYLDSYVTTVGETSAFGNNDQSVGDQYANITLNISPDRQKEGRVLLDPLTKRVTEEGLVGVTVNAEAGGPPTGAPVEVNFSSEDTDLLRSTVREAERILQGINGVQDVETTLPSNNAGFAVVVDRNALFRFGVDLSSVATTLVGATDGIELFEITEFGNDVQVIVRNKLDFTQTESVTTKEITPDALAQLSVLNRVGEQILLGSLISFELAEADSEIQHKDGVRDVTLSSEIQEGINAGEVRDALRDELASMVPDGVVYKFGGEAAEQDQSFAEVGVAFIAGIFIMFSILILQFGKWRQTVIVLSVIPFALAGVLLGLFVSGNALSFPAVLGLIALAGIVVNNSIILVSVFNQLREKHPEWSLEEIVIRGSSMRLRPVVLTTVTTIIGVSPLLSQSALWSPIAYAIIFGLFFCIFVTLAMIPLLYRRLEGFRGKRVRDFGSWFITVLILVLLPLILAGIGSVLFSKASGKAQASLILFALIAGVLLYVFTHIHKKEH